MNAASTNYREISPGIFARETDQSKVPGGLPPPESRGASQRVAAVATCSPAVLSAQASKASAVDIGHSALAGDRWPRPADPIEECKRLGQELYELRRTYEVLSLAYAGQVQECDRLRKQNAALSDLAREWGREKCDAELRAHTAERRLAYMTERQPQENVKDETGPAAPDRNR